MASSVNFEGHFVTSESRSPTNVVALLAHGDDDLAALAERVGDRAAVADRHGGGALAVAHAEVDAAGRVAHRVVDDLAGELVGRPRLGASCRSLGVTASLEFSTLV